MTSNKQHDEGSGRTRKSDARSQASEWASGLRQLYDSVVEEPLPDSFRDILAQLDEQSVDNGQTDQGGHQAGRHGQRDSQQ